MAAKKVSQAIGKMSQQLDVYNRGTAVEKAINKAVEVGVPLDELEAEFNRWLAQKEAPRPKPKREIKPVAPSTSPEELARLEAEFNELLEEEAGDKLFDIKYFMKRLAE